MTNDSQQLLFYFRTLNANRKHNRVSLKRNRKSKFNRLTSDIMQESELGRIMSAVE